MPLHLPLLQAGKEKLQLVALVPKQLTEFVRQSPLISGAVIGGTGLLAGGGILVAQQIKRRKLRKRQVRGVRRARPRQARRRRGRTGFFTKKRHPRRTHKHRVTSGLDRVHRKGKKGISLKAIRASIASPKTPLPLKRGLRKLLRKRTRR